MKIGIVGAGMVGSAAAYAMVMRGIGSEIVLVDKNRALAEAQAQDIVHATPFAYATRVSAGDFPDLAGAGVVMISAGVGQKPGESRLSLLGRNVDIFSQLIPAILKEAPDTILLVASNPVDVMTHVTAKLSGLPARRVIGSAHLSTVSAAAPKAPSSGGRTGTAHPARRRTPTCRRCAGPGPDRGGFRTGEPDRR